MIVKARLQTVGAHTRVAMFMAPALGRTFVNVGELMMREDEAEALIGVLLEGRASSEVHIEDERAA